MEHDTIDACLDLDDREFALLRDRDMWAARGEAAIVAEIDEEIRVISEERGRRTRAR